MLKNNNYQSILSSAFLFGFVQLINILAKVIVSKTAAMLLGPQGVGVIAIYTSTLGVLKTIAGLGIHQSAVKEISAANNKSSITHVSLLILVVKRLVLFSGFLGGIAAILLAPILSQWTFHDHDHVYEYMIVGFAVIFTILWEGELAILRGTRSLNHLAKASIIGALLSILISVPLYVLFKEKGILPILVLTPFIAWVVARHYSSKIQYESRFLSIQSFLSSARSILVAGFSISIAVVLSQIATLIIIIYISNHGGKIQVGLYSTGIMIMVGYFSVILNALTTDYYPRIAVIHMDNSKLKQELNNQSIISILICIPIIIIFYFFSSIIVVILFSEDFLPVIEFIKIGILGVFITIISNQVDLILIIKNKNKLYITVAVVYRLLEVIISITFYKMFGLSGLGYAMILTAFIHLIVMYILITLLYQISYTYEVFKVLIGFCFFLFISIGFGEVEDELMRYSLGVAILFLSVLFVYSYMRLSLEINIKDIFKKR